jgi:phosphoribosylanthranilate isomerase
VLVKICGITRPEDAAVAVEQGAHALGFVFWPNSPRFIDPYRARAIVSALPSFVTTVGVFVNQRSEYVNGVAALVGLAAVQLHGDESPSYAAAMTRPVVKAIALGAAGQVDAVAWPLRVTLLLDVDDPVRRGGTGSTIDWASASTIAAARRVVLAGGLTPENVGDAIRRVKPFGIDVSSGVESSPGIKDHGRLKALFDAVSAERHSLRSRAAPAAQASGGGASRE